MNVRPIRIGFPGHGRHFRRARQVRAGRRRMHTNGGEKQGVGPLMLGRAWDNRLRGADPGRSYEQRLILRSQPSLQT